MDGRQWWGMALVCAAGALAVVHSAQAQVYKCTGGNGETVYAQQPCGTGAKEVTIRANRAATRTPGEAATQSAVLRFHRSVRCVHCRAQLRERSAVEHPGAG